MSDQLQGASQQGHSDGPADRWTDKLSEYLDGELTPVERGALEDHLRRCDACAVTLEELRSVVQRARALDDTPPREDLWPGIATRLGSPPALVTRLRPRVSHISLTLPQLAAACLALMVVSAGGALLLRDRSEVPASRVAQQPRGEGLPTDAGAPATFATSFGGEAYDTAVADLQRALADGRGRLDPATLATLEQNLAIIDRALEQARRAVAADPGSIYLNEHLADTMRRKHELLRRATLLAST